MLFNSLGLSEALLKAISKKGYTTPSPIQQKAIPPIFRMKTTDIDARGLDIPLLPYVVNFELPNISEDYVHIIGRTGRAGASGEAISLVSADETTYLRDIEKLVGITIPVEIVEGFNQIKCFYCTYKTWTE